MWVDAQVLQVAVVPAFGSAASSPAIVHSDIVLVRHLLPSDIGILLFRHPTVFTTAPLPVG